MAAETFTALDGQMVSDGQLGTFTLRHGSYEVIHQQLGVGTTGEPVQIEVRGTAHYFEQVERIYDEEHIAVGKTVEKHWEVVTDNPTYPAVGFLPENVLTFIED